jgi:hypothetical protein
MGPGPPATASGRVKHHVRAWQRVAVPGVQPER